MKRVCVRLKWLIWAQKMNESWFYEKRSYFTIRKLILFQAPQTIHSENHHFSQDWFFDLSLTRGHFKVNSGSNTKEWGQFNSSRSKTTESSRFISALFSSSLKAHRFLFFQNRGKWIFRKKRLVRRQQRNNNRHSPEDLKTVWRSAEAWRLSLKPAWSQPEVSQKQSWR